MNKLYLNLLAMLLGLWVLALFAGEFENPQAIIQQRTIEVYDVAEKIKSKSPVLLIDLRTPQQQAEFKLPTAITVKQALVLLTKDEQDESAKEIPSIVVYGFENNRRWLKLHHLGYPLYFLHHGTSQWLQKILSPVVYRHAPAEELRLFAIRADLSRYFGGLPRYSDTPVKVLSDAEQLEELRRRGCGF
jgi:hypothetical protein